MGIFTEYHTDRIAGSEPKVLEISKDRLRKVLEIANPDIEISDICVDHMNKWCEYQIEIVRDILEGRIAPTFNGKELQLHRYPKNIANSIALLLADL